MNKTLTAALCAAALALSGCAGRAADGHIFKPSAPPRQAVSVRLVEYPNYHEMRAAIPEGAKVDSPMAWARLNGEICEIHIVSLSVYYLPEWLGHELSHCFYGAWHD